MLEWSMLLLVLMYSMSCERCERPLRFFVSFLVCVMIWFVYRGEVSML